MKEAEPLPYLDITKTLRKILEITNFGWPIISRIKTDPTTLSYMV